MYESSSDEENVGGGHAEHVDVLDVEDLGSVVGKINQAKVEPGKFFLKFFFKKIGLPTSKGWKKLLLKCCAHRQIFKCI